MPTIGLTSRTEIKIMARFQFNAMNNQLLK